LFFKKIISLDDKRNNNTILFLPERFGCNTKSISILFYYMSTFYIPLTQIPIATDSEPLFADLSIKCLKYLSSTNFYGALRQRQFKLASCSSSQVESKVCQNFCFKSQRRTMLMNELKGESWAGVSFSGLK